ncbi:MAG: ribulose-phosphate 3-epimerase [Desulfovibrio sp.]|uniref:ribulose-phosphate 3-epimerase n=1 Tax=Desulfovibrio sp. 7SRBS1 TaxID=3378064 RepID=UPI003B3C0E0D
MSKDIILSPSLLSADFSRLSEEVKALEAGGLKWVHLDVMDGHFVPNITYGPPVIKAMRKECSLFFDCHLMIDRPERYIPEFVDAGADMLVVHAESTNHLERVVTQISDLNVKCGVALNPATPPEAIKYLLPQLDMVLVMSVNPGFGGQMFIPFSLQKIRDLKEMIMAAGSKALIQVDGGVTPENVADLVDAGTDVLVTGSAFFKFPPYDKRRELFEFLAHNRFAQDGM